MKQSSLDLIISTAFELLSRNASASMSDIATHAGVGRATVHRYFATRDALIETLALRALADLNSAVDAAVQDATNHLDALRRAMAAIVPMAHQHVFLSTHPTTPELSAAFDAATAELRATIDTARAEGSLTSPFPTVWIARSYDALTFAAWEAIAAQDLTPDQAISAAWHSFLNGITGEQS